MAPLNDAEMLSLVTPMLPEKLQKQLKEIEDAKEAIKDAKDAIRLNQYNISEFMYVETKGEISGALNWHDKDRIDAKKVHRKQVKTLLSD